jgi:hypothetical protein
MDTTTTQTMTNTTKPNPRISQGESDRQREGACLSLPQARRIRTVGKTAKPTLRILNLSGGVQSTALAILATTGRTDPVDYAVYADHGWEPPEVHAQLDLLEREVLRPAGVPLYRIVTGDLRADCLAPGRGFAPIPLHIRTPSGVRSMGTRQCSGQYKTRPLLRVARNLLGADSRYGPVSGGRWAEMWLGISVDEAQRAERQRGRSYAVYRWPLLELGLSRQDCQEINERAGFRAPRTACIGCPFKSDEEWRRLRDEHPEQWADAVEFDEAIRGSSGLRGEAFLHRSLVPLRLVELDGDPVVERAVRGVEAGAGGLTVGQVERLRRVVG